MTIRNTTFVLQNKIKVDILCTYTECIKKVQRKIVKVKSYRDTFSIGSYFKIYVYCLNSISID